MDEDPALVPIAFVVAGFFILTPLKDRVLNDDREIKQAHEVAARPQLPPLPKLEMKSGCELVITFSESGKSIRTFDCP